MHCDGARLWEVVAAGAGSLAEFSACFDTVSLCFSKGLGAPIGSIVVGPKRVIKHGRWVRKSIGGGLRQSGVVTTAARVAVDVTFGKDSNGRDGLLKATHDTARRVEKMWTGLGGRMQHPVETNMCWLDLASMKCSPARFEQLGRETGIKLMGNRRKYLPSPPQPKKKKRGRGVSVFPFPELSIANYSCSHNTLSNRRGRTGEISRCFPESRPGEGGGGPS